jgi:hypothetical protein
LVAKPYQLSVDRKARYRLSYDSMQKSWDSTSQ